MKYIARTCAYLRNDCQDRIGETCNFRGWRDGEEPKVFCKNYQRCQASKGARA